MQTQSIHVICTSAGNDGFPSVLQALKADPAVAVTGVDANPQAAGLILADEGRTVPLRSKAEQLITSILDLAQPDRANILLPLSTEDQDFFSLHKAEIEARAQYLKVIVASTEALKIANDKHELYRHCTETGTPTPNYTLTSDPGVLSATVKTYAGAGLRCVLKLARGTGAQGVKILDPGIDQASSFWSRTQLSMHPEKALEWFGKFGLRDPIMISDFLNGEHISVDAIRTAQGDFHATARTETSHLYGLALTGEIIDAPDVITASKRLAESIGLTGAMNFEYRRDDSGAARLLEINPRFGGSIGHTVAAGMNLPLMLLTEHVDLNVTSCAATIGFPLRRHWSILNR